MTGSLTRWSWCGALVFACADPAGRTPPSSTPASAAPSASSTASSPPPESSVAARWPRETPPRIDTDWCIPVMSTLDEETCYALPDEPTRVLLVYLHGIVPPTRDSPQKTNLETVIANASRRAHAAALLPRGEQGLVTKYPDWWGWPTGEAGYRAHASRLVAKVRAKRAALERVAGAKFTRVYLAGSSAGAYFVAALALHGGFDADGFGILSGGSGWRTPELATLDPKPVYIGYGKHDTVEASARALHDLFRSAGWPVRLAAHPLGHGAKEIYLDEAFTFWKLTADR